MKVCYNCKIDKLPSDFHKNKSRNGGLADSCKVCKAQQDKEYSIKNKEKLSLQHKNYYIKNKDVLKEYSTEYRKLNPEIIKERKRQYYLKNRNRLLKKSQTYQKNTADKRQLRYKRKLKDPVFRLKEVIRKRLIKALKRKHYNANSNLANFLGCSWKEFKIYIELQFEDWMSWDKYGLYNGEKNYGFDIDHIIPL